MPSTLISDNDQKGKSAECLREFNRYVLVELEALVFALYNKPVLPAYVHQVWIPGSIT